MNRPRYAFQYAVLRAVPRVDRGEFVNVGVIVYCQQLNFLHTATDIHDARLRNLCAEVDVEAVRFATDAVVARCQADIGHARENTGLSARFGMLTAPRSTVVQPSPVHAGMTADPEQTLTDLMAKLVETPQGDS